MEFLRITRVERNIYGKDLKPSFSAASITSCPFFISLFENYENYCIRQLKESASLNRYLV